MIAPTIDHDDDERISLAAAAVIAMTNQARHTPPRLISPGRFASRTHCAGLPIRFEKLFTSDRDDAADNIGAVAMRAKARRMLRRAPHISPSRLRDIDDGFLARPAVKTVGHFIDSDRRTLSLSDAAVIPAREQERT